MTPFCHDEFKQPSQNRPRGRGPHAILDGPLDGTANLVLANRFDDIANQNKGLASHRVGVIAGLGGFDAFVDLYTGNPRRSQWSMLVDADGKLGVDFVGRLENLEADVAAVATRLGLPPVSLPHRNRAESKPWRDYYTPRSMQWVSDRWRTEIGTFGYRFDQD